MRGEIMYKILDFLEDRSFDMFDFSTAFLNSGSNATIGRFEYELSKTKKARRDYKLSREELRRFQKYVYKLRSEGLIVRGRGDALSVSDKGKERLTLLRRDKLLDKNNFQKSVGEKFIIVSYDLPNRLNIERDRLREALRALGFRMIHKSVWVGKVKLPENFIQHIEKLGLHKFIEILEVTKKGTLKELI